MAEKQTIEPVIALSATNLAWANYPDTDGFVAVGEEKIECSKWGGFICNINVLSYDGSPTLFFKVQHSAVDPSDVAYDSWTDLLIFPPITTVGMFSQECPNESVAQFGRWLRVVHCQTGSGSNAATIGDIVFGARE